MIAWLSPPVPISSARPRAAAARSSATSSTRPASPGTPRSTSRRCGTPASRGGPHEYFDRDRHANIIERLAFREMPDGPMPEPSPLWQPDATSATSSGRSRRARRRTASSARSSCGATSATSPRCCAASRATPGGRCPSCSPASFPDLRYVQITREDKVRQAVSLWKAVQTQAWRRRARPRRARGRAGVLVPRDQLPRAPAHRARRLLGRLLPRPRRRAAQGHLRGARRGARPGRPAGARARRRRGARPTCGSTRRSSRSRPTSARRTGSAGSTSTSRRSRRPPPSPPPRPRPAARRRRRSRWACRPRRSR